MPWTVSDVDKHKKGLTPEQKKKWVSIANGVYKDCMKTGSDKTCAPKAIRIANSKFEEGGNKLDKHTEVKKLNTSVLQFEDPEATFVFKEEGENKTSHIIAYSGKPFPHWYWGKVAMDVKGMTHKPTIPVLEQHDLDRKVGFTGSPIITPAFQVTHEDITFLDTPFAEDFQKNSKKGFPYEASMYSKPSIIEEVEEGATTEVNGHKFVGPGSIFRQWEYKEVSVCVFGADKNTKAKAFEGGEDFEVEVFRFVDSSNITIKEEVKSMFDLEKMKTEDPEGYQKLMDTIKEEAKKEVESQFTAVITSLKAEIEAQKEINLKFQKAEDIRKEKEVKMAAEVIWAKSLANTPERLHVKIKNQVNYEKFMKEGVLDETAFTEAVVTELKDWEDFKTSSVQGFGMTSKEIDGEDDTKFKAENESWLNKMLNKVGQKKS